MEAFEFGRNWTRFLAVVDEDRIQAAEQSLRTALRRDSLEGVRFLDVGSGSGLFSLAARRLGATVRSFDSDVQSVACTKEMKRRYLPDSGGWVIECGSALDPAYMRSLGRYDIVYAWGVLHHTGDLWTAMEHTVGAVAPGGSLYVAIYDDQGTASRRWRAIKRTYVRGGRIVRWGLLGGVALYFAARRFVGGLLQGRIVLPGTQGDPSERGMSRWHDLIDWVGGYPFEVAKPEEVFEFCRERGLRLTFLKTRRGTGCNQFVFRAP